jgi:Bacterial Ig-like domain/FG-GAP-like repeat
MTMTGYLRVLAPLAGLLAASLSLLVFGAGANGLVCEPSWSTLASSEHLRKPSAIATIASNDIWVVGSTKDTTHAIRTGAEHWDGSSWSQVPAPDVGTGANALNGVDALASNDIWAVGYSEVSGRYSTLIEHWDGTRWRIVTSPNAGTSGDNVLTSVDALSGTNAWAVGSSRAATSRKSLIQRWNGSSWTIVSSPNPGTLSNSLLGVAAAGPNDIWAVGWKNSGNGLQSLLLHYDGTGWTEGATVPKVGTGDNVLTGISVVSNDDVWATGYYVDGTKYRTLTLHYNGTTWSHVPSPNGADGTDILMGIDASSPTNAWAVGFEYRAALDHYVASTQLWDGSSWTAFPSAISGNGTQESAMFDVAKAPGTSQVWAVGRSGLRLTLGGLTGVVETICPSGSSTVTAPAQEGGGIPTESSVPASEQPNSVPIETSGSSTSVAATSSGIPVSAVDKAADAGISENTRTYGAIIADFNNDTKPDIFLGRHGEQPSLYENAGNGHFQETNQGTFARADRHGCDAADVNGDGLKDIFCTEGANLGTSPKRNELYIQQPDHTFAEQAGQYGVLDPFGRGRSARFFDANGDGRPDLFLSNDPTRGDGMPSPNRFFTNQLGGALRYAPEYGLELETSFQGSLNASVGDLDKDGWQDLLLITPQGLRVYHNEQGKSFTEVSASVGLGQSPHNVTLADVNGDGWLDVIEVEPNKLSVLVNTNGEFSSVFSTTLQYGYSVAAGDVNSDNRPDIYVMRGTDTAGNNAPDQVYLNDGSGASFTQMSSIPSTSQGTPDSVAPIDYDGNGLTDFLVLNGGGENESGPGPVELIAFFGSTGGSTGPLPGPPSVTGTSPAANATRVAPTTDVTATFSEDMKVDTITGQTFKLTKKGTTTKIAAAVSYDASTDTAKLDPNQNLTSGVTYKAVITTGARDAAGNPLAQQYRWFFTVG